MRFFRVLGTAVVVLVIIGAICYVVGRHGNLGATGAGTLPSAAARLRSGEGRRVDTELSRAVQELVALNEHLRQNPAGERARLSEEQAALVLSESPAPGIRAQTASVLGQLGGETAEARLVDMAASDADPGVREQALSALLSMQSSKALPLLRRLLHEGDVGTRQAVARVVSRMAEPRLLADILQELKTVKGKGSETRAIQNSLIAGLRRLAHPDACPVLLRLLRLEPEPRHKSTIAVALAESATAAESELLVKALGALGPVGNTQTTQGVIYLLRKLGQLNDWRSTEAVVACLGWQNSSVARTVIAALSQMRDPLAAEALVRRLGETQDAYERRQITALLKDGYPGVRYDETTKGYQIIKGAAMADILRKRETVIADYVKSVKIPTGEEKAF